MDLHDKYIAGRCQDPPPGPADAELDALREENRAFARLARQDAAAPSRQATLQQVYARAGATKELTVMSNLFAFLRGRRWYVQLAAVAAVLAVLGAGVLLLPALHAGRGGQLGLSPNAAWASSEEYALVCSDITQMTDEVHEQARALMETWAAERNAASASPAREVPLARFIEPGADGAVKVYLVYPGAARADIEDLQRQLEAIPGAPSGEITETTLLFPSGTPAFENGVVKTEGGRVFCIAGDPGDEELHGLFLRWLHHHGVDVHSRHGSHGK